MLSDTSIFFLIFRNSPPCVITLYVELIIRIAPPLPFGAIGPNNASLTRWICHPRNRRRAYGLPRHRRGARGGSLARCGKVRAHRGLQVYC